MISSDSVIRTLVDGYPNDRVSVPLLGQERTLDLSGGEHHAVSQPVIRSVSGPSALQISGAFRTRQNGTSREFLHEPRVTDEQPADSNLLIKLDAESTECQGRFKQAEYDPDPIGPPRLFLQWNVHNSSQEMEAFFQVVQASRYDLIAIQQPPCQGSFRLPVIRDPVVGQLFDVVWAADKWPSIPNVCTYVRKSVNWGLISCTANLVSIYLVGLSPGLVYVVHNVYDGPPSDDILSEFALQEAFARADEMGFKEVHHLVFGNYRQGALDCDGQSSNLDVPGLQRVLDATWLRCVMPQQLILRQQTILLSDAVEGEEQESLDGDFEPLKATYAVCKASQNLHGRVYYVRDLNTLLNTQTLGPFEVSLKISLLGRSKAERRLRWEDIDLPRLKTMVTSHLGSRVLRGPARIIGPRQNLWSAKGIDAFTEWIVDNILAAVEASAPWYFPGRLLVAKLSQCSNQDRSVPSTFASRMPGPDDDAINYYRQSSTSAREREILERIRMIVASNVSSGQVFVPDVVLHAISVPITPALAVLFDQCFDAEHYPTPISEVQIRPPTSPDVESLDDDHPNVHIRVALLHTIGHILKDINTDPTEYSLHGNCVISRMSLRSPCSWCEQQPDPSGLVKTAAETTEYQGLFQQPYSSPITEEQLINKVREIYAGIKLVEKKCIEIDNRQEDSKAELCQAHWQELISVHRILLYGYHEFHTTCQHPSASVVLKRLPKKYAIPARMWRVAIQPLLEILRRKLPNSLDYMLGFINLAYSMITDLLERVEPFQDIWIECLGDLARYGMAAEKTDSSEREAWAAVSRKWYNQYADRSPDVGRIQNHLAILARPEVLQQFFYYTKALVCVRPFPAAREGISRLLDACVYSQLLYQPSVVTTFLATHGALFTKGPPEQFIARSNYFLSLFRREIGGLCRAGQHVFYIMSANFAAMLQYGEPEATMTVEFVQKKSSTIAEAHALALEWTSKATTASLPCDKAVSINGQPTKTASQILSLPAFQGSRLAFRTLSIVLEQMGDYNVYPSAHISLAFIWCLALHPPAMQQVEQLIPWLVLTKFLNTLFQIDTDFHMIESEAFPLPQYGVTQQLSEDFLIRGQAWSRLYYPERFFEGAPSEDDRPMIEKQTAIILRNHRCLWLGARIATVSSMST